jgi:hypothetical protein
VWDGSTIPPTKTMDGAYHMHGEVIICGKDQQLEHFKAIKPILEMVDNRKGILITPLPRYFHKGCCVDEEHSTNVKEPDYKQKMLQNLDELKNNFKNFLYFDGYKNFKSAGPII